MSPFLMLRRAFVSNLRAVTVGDDERARLESVGIQDPTIQGYFAWRRSLALMVVAASVLSAGLATYREFWEEDEQPQVFSAVSGDLLKQAQQALPVAEMSEEPDEDDDSEEAQTAEVSEAESEEEEEPETAFGRFADFVDLNALYALTLAAIAVLLCWTRFKLSFQILLAGFLFAFFVPMLIALCPWSWWGYDDTFSDPRAEPLLYIQELAESLLEGADYLIALLPTVLSLIPGVQRACLRVKTLLPQSLLPGWFLVVAAPFYGLFLLVIFVAINQVASDPVFLLGMFLFLAAPAVYIIKSEAFTRPLATDEDFQRMRSAQRIVMLVTVSAGMLLLFYITTQQVQGVRLVGLDAKTSLLQPLDLVEFFLEFLARSMFMTLLGADLFLRMTLASWKQSRSFAGTPEAARYDGVMSALEQATA